MPTLTKENLDAVFHDYDVRGTVPEQLDEEFYYHLGKAYVSYLNAKKIAVGVDFRRSSKPFAKEFIKGALELGCDVYSLGEIATEMLYFTVGKDESFDGGVTVTASHNPIGWNGCKMLREKSIPLSIEDGFEEIKKRIENRDYDGRTAKSEGQSYGTLFNLDVYPSFKEKVLSFIGDTDISDVRVVADAGNGIGGRIFDYVFGDQLNHISRRHFEPDDTFPNHEANPMKLENVQDLMHDVHENSADIGIAMDGDTDRVVFVDRRGKVIQGIYTGAILAHYFGFNDTKQTFIHDPKVTRVIEEIIKSFNDVPVVSRSGNTFFKKAMREHNAVFGIEFSSHFYYKDFFYADSGMITIAVMLKLLASGFDVSKKLDEFEKEYPMSGEVNFTVEDSTKIIEKIKQHFENDTNNIDELDGISMEFNDWRFNLRPSNTEPLLRLNVEAHTKTRVVEKFKEIEALIGGKRQNSAILKELN